MTSKRDLGPILGGAGAVIVVAAIVTGFIVVGGPGDARAERFDEMTMERIHTVAHAAQCVMTVSGSAPSTRADLLERVRMGGLPMDSCGYIDTTQIEASDEVEYAALGASVVRLCGTFRRPFGDDETQPGRIVASTQFPELAADRPAGRHCYDVRLRPIPAPVYPPPYPPEETAKPVEAPPLQ